MAIKRITASLTFIFIFPLICYLQEKTAPAYRFKFDGKEVIFTQIFTWEHIDGTLFYEFIIYNEKNPAKIEKVKTDKPVAEVHLQPGNYKYRINSFNLLEQLETQSEWKSCHIKKAILPIIKNISPFVIYIEDEILTLTLTGKNFTDDSTITIKSYTKKEIELRTKERTENSITFIIDKPDEMVGVPWKVTITHPSGLSDTSSPFLVKYKRSIDFYTSIGWAPFFPVHDKWYLSRWKNKIYPISFTGTAGLIFLKRPFGFLGLEYKATFRKSDIIDDGIKLKNFYFLSNFNLVYEYWFAKKWAAFAFAGGGPSYSSFQFIYDKNPAEKKQTVDFFYSIGGGIRWRFYTFAYIDIGMHLDQILHKQLNLAGITPEISIGFRY